MNDLNLVPDDASIGLTKEFLDKLATGDHNAMQAGSIIQYLLRQREEFVRNTSGALANMADAFEHHAKVAAAQVDRLEIVSICGKSPEEFSAERLIDKVGNDLNNIISFIHLGALATLAKGRLVVVGNPTPFGGASIETITSFGGARP